MNLNRSLRAPMRRSCRRPVHHDPARQRPTDVVLFRLPDDVSVASPELVRLWRGW